MKIETDTFYVFTLPSGLEIRLHNPDPRDLEYLDRAFGLRLDAGLNLRITKEMAAVFTLTGAAFEMHPGDEYVCYRKDAPKP